LVGCAPHNELLSGDLFIIASCSPATSQSHCHSLTHTLVTYCSSGFLYCSLLPHVTSIVPCYVTVGRAATSPRWRGRSVDWPVIVAAAVLVMSLLVGEGVSCIAQIHHSIKVVHTFNVCCFYNKHYVSCYFYQYFCLKRGMMIGGGGRSLAVLTLKSRSQVGHAWCKIGRASCRERV
jgi:hypothetical protein